MTSPPIRRASRIGMTPASFSATIAQPQLEALRDQWSALWPQALSLWSKFTRLGEPRWCFTEEAASAEGLTESFAMIRLTDQAVVVSLPGIASHHLEAYGLEILAHEIGHHVYAPADLTDHGRMIA